MLRILQFSKDSLNLREKICHLRNTNYSCKFEKNVSEFKINLIYRGYTVILK